MIDGSFLEIYRLHYSNTFTGVHFETGVSLVSLLLNENNLRKAGTYYGW